MPDAMTMIGSVVGRFPAEQAASIRLCRPGDVTAVAALAARCAWRRRRDTPLILRLLRLAIWPIGAALLTLEGRGLWVNRQRTAILATRPSTDGAFSLRFALLLVGAVVLPIAALGAAAVAAGAEEALLVVYGSLMLLLVDPLRRCRRNPALARARRDLSGPGVVEATNLLAATPGAGVELARALCTMADATGTTVMAEARGAARQRLYGRFGFETVAEVGGAAIIVRMPNAPREAERPGGVAPAPAYEVGDDHSSIAMGRPERRASRSCALPPVQSDTSSSRRRGAAARP